METEICKIGAAVKQNPCGMTKIYKGYQIVYLPKYNLYEIFNGSKFLVSKPTFQMVRDYIDNMNKNPKSRKFDEFGSDTDYFDDEDLAEWEFWGYGTPIYSKKKKRNPVKKVKRIWWLVADKNDKVSFKRGKRPSKKKYPQIAGPYTIGEARFYLHG